MAQGTIHIVTTAKRGHQVLWDEVWCEACVTHHKRAFASDKGVEITTQPWTEDVRACTSCDDSELAPEFKFNAVNQ